MRTLKKTLSFVLVLAMALSLFGTAFAQLDKYEDVESIGDAYVEAVDVLTGIGVLEGMDEDTFAPQGNYTREQAAKILAYIMAGPEGAEKMTATCDVFDDVPADKWSAGYIAYCVRTGVIAGYGDGTFGPADYVTGYQFAKMLLTAVGYNVNKEYEGAKWSVSVAKDAIPLGIFAGDLDAATNEPITREQAALMAFNALFVDKVAYDIRTGKYVSLYNSVDGTADNGPLTTPIDLAEQVFGLHVHEDVMDADGMGFMGYEWADGDENVVSEWYMTDAIMGHYTDTYGLKYADMFKNYAWDEDDVAIFVNGDFATTEDAETFAVKGDVDPWEDYNETGWDFYLVDGNGDGAVDKIVCTVEFLAKVISVKEADTYFEEEATLEVYTGLNINGRGDKEYPVVETAGLTEGQYLLVAPDMVDEEDEDDAEIKWMHMPEQYTGKIEEINTNVTRLVGGYELPNIKVNGVETKFSTFAGNIELDPTYLIGVSAGTYETNGGVTIREVIFSNVYTFTYDRFGNIIGIELLVPVSEIAPNFVHVDAVSLKPIWNEYNLFDIYGLEMRIQVTKMDGTTATYDYPVYSDEEGSFYINVLRADTFDFDMIDEASGIAPAVANKIYTDKLPIDFPENCEDEFYLGMDDLSGDFDPCDLFYMTVNEDGEPTLGYFTGIANGEEAYYAWQLEEGEYLTLDAKYAEVNGQIIKADSDTVLTIKWDNADVEQYVGYENFPLYTFVAGEDYMIDGENWIVDDSIEINIISDEEGDIMEILVNHVEYKETPVYETFYVIPTTDVYVSGDYIKVDVIDMAGNTATYTVSETDNDLEDAEALFPIGQVCVVYLNGDNELVLVDVLSPDAVGTVKDITADYFELEIGGASYAIYFADGIIYDANAYVTPGINTLEVWELQVGDTIAVWTVEGATAGGLLINELVVGFAQNVPFSFGA